MVKLDVMESGDKKNTLENPGGAQIMTDLGGEKAGLPFYAIVDENGKKLADANAMPGNQNIGYPATPEEITAFEGILKKGAPKMKAADRNGLIAYLKKVAPPPPAPRQEC